MRLVIIETVGLETGAIRAVGHRRDGAAHGLVGAVLERGGEGGQIIDLGIGEKFGGAPGTDLGRGDLGEEIAEHLVGDADIRGDEIARQLVDLALLQELHRQYTQAFLEQFAAV